MDHRWIWQRSVGLGAVRYASFPTTIEIGARIWGPLSISVSGAAVLAGREVHSCGRPARPNAGIGGVGLRANLSNGRTASWVDPFVEAHVGVGGQAGRGVHGGRACHLQ